MDWNEKVVWITGASSGIGQELARQVALKGALVVLSSRNEQALCDVQEKLFQSEKHLVLPLDLENGDFSNAVLTVQEKYGRIDVLVNNGGVSQRSSVNETPISVDRKIMEINYTSDEVDEVWVIVWEGRWLLAGITIND